MPDTHVICERSKVDDLFSRGGWPPDPARVVELDGVYIRSMCEGDAWVVADVGAPSTLESLLEHNRDALTSKFQDPVAITFAWSWGFRAEARRLLFRTLDDPDIVVDDDFGNQLAGSDFVNWLREHPDEDHLPCVGDDQDDE